MSTRVDRNALDAIVRKLKAIQGQGGLTTAEVARMADVLDLSERQLWRLIGRGTAEIKERPKFELNKDQLVEIAECRGNVKLAYDRLKKRDAIDVSVITARRAYRRQLSESERAYIRFGEHARRASTVALAEPEVTRNAIWELDHVQLPIEVVVPRSKQIERPWGTFCIDRATRAITGFSINLSPTSADVLLALRHGIALDERYGPFEGTPEVLRWDNGREFTSDAVTQVATQLGCYPQVTPAYTPSRKGVIERFNKTIQEASSMATEGWASRSSAKSSTPGSRSTTSTGPIRESAGAHRQRPGTRIPRRCGSPIRMSCA
jgi:putative transposase